MTTQRANESMEIDGGALGKLTFLWAEDRYQHHWTLGSDVSIRSVESGSSEAWPSSPPLQQVHQQSFADGREVIFGVGMAGRGHWSASFTLVPELGCWIAELACRCPVEPQRLVSSYTASHALAAESESKYAVGEQTGISLEAIAPGTVAGLKDDQLSFSPVAISSGDTTSQWAFRLRCG